MSESDLETLEASVDSGVISQSDLDRLVELLNHDDLETRESAAELLKTYSKDHPDEVVEVVDELIPCVRDSDQSSSRRSDLGEALSQVALEHPLPVKPVAETLFSFTVKPWRFYSFSDAVAAIAAESEETRQMLREYVETGSKAKRNNALFILTKVTKDDPAAVEDLLPLFADVAEDSSEYLKQRGFAAECLGRVAPDGQYIEFDTIETLLNAKEKSAVEGGTWALRNALQSGHSPTDPDDFLPRVEELKENRAENLYVYHEERKALETIHERLSEIGSDGTADEQVDAENETKLYSGKTGTDSRSEPSFCPACGTNLQDYDEPSFCIDCGKELS